MLAPRSEFRARMPRFKSTDMRMSWTSICAIVAVLVCVANRDSAADEPRDDYRTLKPVWLTDLPEQNVVVADGHFGKHGMMGAVLNMISIHNIASHFGIGWAAPGHVEYSLGGKYRTFRGTAALNDTAGLKVGRPIELRVLGDGKLLWTSNPLYRALNGRPFMLDISGVKVLRLEADFLPNTTGDETRRHVILYDPWLSEKLLPQSELDLYSPAADARTTKIAANYNKLMAAFKADRFTEVEELLKDWRSKPDSYEANTSLEEAYDGLSRAAPATDDGWEKLFARLKRWQAADPKSFTPLAALCEAYSHYGWEARGKDLAVNVSRQNMEKFDARIKLAHEAWEQAEALGDDVQMCCLRIGLAQAEGQPDDAKEPFQKGLKLCPHYRALYEGMALILEPEWYGKDGDVEKFASMARSQLGGDLGDAMYFYIAALQFKSHFLYVDFFEKSGFNYPEVERCMKIAMRDHPENNRDLNSAAQMASIAKGGEKIAGSFLRKLDPITFIPGLSWENYGEMSFFRTAMLVEPHYGCDRLLRDKGGIASVGFLKHEQLIISAGEFEGFNVRSTLRIHGEPKNYSLRGTVKGLSVAGDGSAFILRRVPGSDNPPFEALVFFVEKGHPAIHLKGHSAELNGQAISNDATLCATASSDHTAKIWSIADPSHPISLEHPDEAYNVAFSPDGKTLASSDFVGVVRLWDTKSGAMQGAPLGKPGTADSKCRLVFTPDGKELITGAFDRTIRRWDLQNRTSRELKLDGEIPLSQIGITPDGTLLAVGRNDGELDIVSLDNFKVLSKHYGHFGPIYGMAFTGDNKRLLTSSLDGTIRFWSLGGMTPVKILTFPEYRGLGQ